MENFVTLFDSLFLPQGLALNESLEKHAGNYTLWILCIDEAAYEVLNSLHLPNVKLIRLADVETPDLKRVKGGRTRAEYCWTLTPFTPRFVFERDDTIQRVTYLDADLWFRKSPRPIFEEFEASGKHVLITDHAYAPEYDSSDKNGQYCVQFMTFERDSSEKVRQWWEERCIEWCYAHYEDGKLGDQKYLDDWTERFPTQVHVLQQKEWTLGPWNTTRFPYGTSRFYHFHGLRILKNRKIFLGGYPLSDPVINGIYLPYLDALNRAFKSLNSVGFIPKPQKEDKFLISSLKFLKYFILGMYLQTWRFNSQNYLYLRK